MRRSLAGNASGGSIRAAAALTAGVLVAGLVAPASVFAGDASPVYSEIFSDPYEVRADGITTAPVTIKLRDASGAPVATDAPTFRAADYPKSRETNVYGPCTPTADVGVWKCSLASTLAGVKVLEITSPIYKTGGSVTFVAGEFAGLIIQLWGENTEEGTRAYLGAPQPWTIGDHGSVLVAAVDANWNVVESAAPTVHFTSSDPHATLPADGVLSGVSGHGGGRYFQAWLETNLSTITATVVGDESKTYTTVPIPVVKLQVLLPGETPAPSGTCKTGAPDGQTVGTPFTITIREVDSGCARVARGDRLRLTSTDPNAAALGDVTLGDGTGTLEVTLKTAGSWTIAANLNNSAGPGPHPSSSAPVSVGSPPFAKLQLLVPGETAAPGTTSGKTGTPATQVAGVPFTVTVDAVDDNWNPVSSTNAIHFASTDPAAVLPLDTALADGTKSFSVTLQTSGRTITAMDLTDTSKTSSTSPPITVSTPTASGLAFTTQPTNVAANTLFPVAPVVTVQDINGLTVSSSASITLAFASNPTGASLSCASSKQATAGSATFTGCSVDKAGTYTLLATSPGLAPATSAPFTVGVGTGYKLAFTAQPTTVGTGAPFPVSPAVIVKDVNGSAIITNASITLALAGNPTGVTLTCSGGLTRSASTGAAIFTDCSVDKAGTYTLLATSSGLLSATSVSFTVGTGVASLTLTPSATTITWSGTVILTVRLSTAYAGRQVALLGTRDGVNFAPIATLTTGSGGTASFSYRPATNLYYRATFAGAPDLAATTSNTTRVVVRQIALLRPTNSGAIKSIARGTTRMFTTTVRPSRPGLLPASVTYLVYRNVNGVWVQYFTRNVVAASTGVASFTWTFASSGLWYVRSMANATPYNANSVKSPAEQYKVS